MRLKFTLHALIILSIMTGCAKNYSENDITPKPKNDTQSDIVPHYWAGNKKVIMEAQPEKSFIIFNGTDRYDIIDADKMDYSVFKTAKVPEGRMFRKGLTRAADIENATWAIGTTRAFYMAEDKILYKSQAYKNSKGTDIFVSHLFYVKLKSAADYPELQRMADENNVEILGQVGEHLDLWYKLACSAESDCDALAMSARFYESGLFQYAEPDIMFEIRPCSKLPNSYPEYQAPTRVSDAPAPNDPLFPQQWYLHNPGGLDINYLEAKAITQGDSNITIVVIDPEGVTYNHPDLPDKVNAYYDYNTASNHGDCHATECLGIICAKTDNNTGIAGIAPNCNIKYYRIPNWGLDYSIVANTLMHATSGVDVLSCSWEFNPEADFEGMMMISEVFYQIRQTGRWHHNEDKDLGAVVIFAAGNSKMTHPSYIAGWADIAVCAMNKNGTLHITSNQSSIIAPGEEIYTTTTTSTKQEVIAANFGHRLYTPIFDQTSSACPQVAAVAALILSLNPDLYYYEVANYITRTAKQLPSGCYQNGKLLDAGAALQAVLNDMQK